MVVMVSTSLLINVLFEQGVVEEGNEEGKKKENARQLALENLDWGKLP